MVPLQQADATIYAGIAVLNPRIQLAHVAALSDALAIFGGAVRRNISEAGEAGDEDTADLFTEVSRSIDKHLWFVEVHAQAKR